MEHNNHPDAQELNLKAYSTQEYMFHQTTPQLLDYHNKKPPFTGEIDDWVRHLCQFNSICDTYKACDADNLKYFAHSLAPPSAVHQIVEGMHDRGVNS